MVLPFAFSSCFSNEDRGFPRQQLEMHHVGSLGMLQRPCLHGAGFGDGDRLPLMSRVVPTILLAWEAVEEETLGWEITFLGGCCCGLSLHPRVPLLGASGALRAFAPSLLGLGGTHILQGWGFGSTPGFYFLPLAGSQGAWRGRIASCSFLRMLRTGGGGGDGNDSSV